VEDKTILVVDDSTTNLDILVDLLSDYNVIDITNGKDALEIIHEEKIDLILLDIMMPEMNGLEVCRGITAIPNTLEFAIIFITALNDEKDIERACALEGIYYIPKPCKPTKLLSTDKVKFPIEKSQNNTLSIKQNL